MEKLIEKKKCESCIHKKVCDYIGRYNEMVEKVNNQYFSIRFPFELELNCDYYKEELENGK